LPDHDDTLTGENMSRTCDGYCTSIGRTCTGAWEEQDDDCAVRFGMSCDEELATSDAICECGLAGGPFAEEIEECIPYLFRFVDTDGDGCVSAGELVEHRRMRVGGGAGGVPWWSTGTASLASIDRDGDGCVSEDEWIRYIDD